MKKRIITITVGLAIAGIQILAQPKGAGNMQGTRPGGGIGPAEGKISGKVLDATSNEPIEYASVAIYRAKDSTLVTGGVTNPAGSFMVENLPFGKFYAKVTFLGYQRKFVDNIMVVPNQKIVTLGTIKLDVNSTKLNEVVVTGTVEYKIDKKVVNINQNLTAAGGTVVDALQNTPSVQTDVEGNVTVRGSSNFTVLIDGKPSVVQGSEALQQIPAGLVQNVEIITNPSAKYDAEGSAGIINVVMKKQKLKGFNGSISLSAGTTRKNNDNINVNYKYDKFNFSLGLDYADMDFKTNNSSQSQYSNLSGTVYKNQLMNASGQFSRKGEGLRAGIEYSINNNSSLSLSGRVGDRSFNRPMNAYYIDTYPLTGNNVYYISSNSGSSTSKFYSLNLDYNLNLNEKGQQLSATAYYSRNNEDGPNVTTQDTTNNLWVSNNLLPFTQMTNEPSKEYDARFKVDYSYQIMEKTRLEAGVQSKINNNSATHHFFQNNIENMGQLDDLDFKDIINTGYVTFSSSTKLFDYQLGLRAEHENRDVKQKNLNQDTTVTVKRIDLFPTIHISKQLPWDMQLQVSYTRRISRPRNWNLSPLPRNMDPQHIQVGNPALLPEFMDAYELNIQKKINEMSSVSFEGFYRKTNNPIQQFTSIVNDINYSTVGNLGKDERAGGEMTLNLGLTKWWSIMGSGSLFNRKLSGSMHGVSSKSNTDWNFRGNTTLRLKTGTSFQLNYLYNAPSITAQGTRGASYSTSLAIRQDVLKKKGNLTLQIRDFVGDMETSMTTKTPTFYSSSIMKRESKVITLTFMYRINNYKAEKRSAPEMNNDSDRNGDMGGVGM